MNKLGEYRRLFGKIAVVTGGSDGIGRGIAAKLAAEGANVIINGRSHDKGEAATEALRASGGKVSFVGGDVFVAADMRALVDRVLSAHGRIDICVASGGGSHYARPGDGIDAMGFFHEIDAEDVAGVVARATIAKLQPARAVVEHMIAQRSGSILFVTSEGGRFPTPGQTAVSLYAGGLIAMTKVVAKELARHTVRVNALAISLVRDTPAWSYAYDNPGYDPVIQDKLLAKAPFGLATPADIADVAAYLVSDEARFITGATISATGGLTYSG